MYWLFLLLALGAFVLAISATQTWLLLLSLLASLVFALLWVKGLYAARIGGALTDAPRALHPAELQALREQFRVDAAAPTVAPPPPVQPATPDRESPQP
ncbi:hypothetical protein [Stenotrophomonas pictorum]|uniref:hypothetical protein n=1 Tax=Stenotrophomonas pictorum TaxID=86184 RepID=UPI000A7CA929|nr:hypothetical protein [Stenotrophomonas pictorum]